MHYVRTMQATAEVVPPPTPDRPSALTEETEILLRWLEAPGVRIVELDGTWTCPVGGAGSVRSELEPAVAIGPRGRRVRPRRARPASRPRRRGPAVTAAACAAPGRPG